MSFASLGFHPRSRDPSSASRRSSTQTRADLRRSAGVRVPRDLPGIIEGSGRRYTAPPSVPRSCIGVPSFLQKKACDSTACRLWQSTDPRDLTGSVDEIGVAVIATESAQVKHRRSIVFPDKGMMRRVARKIRNSGDLPGGVDGHSRRWNYRRGYPGQASANHRSSTKRRARSSVGSCQHSPSAALGRLWQKERYSRHPNRHRSSSWACHRPRTTKAN